MGLLDECIRAHGGMEAFRGLRGVEMRLRTGGLALPMKLRPRVTRDVRVRVDLHEPSVEFAGVGVWRGSDPRPSGMPTRPRWSDADVVHFAGYALWNYLAAPFLWARCEVVEIEDRRLRILFPPSIPTHCREQVAHVDAAGLVRRLDYTAEVFGPWARAQNVCLAYERVGGVTFAVRRRVTPRGLERRPVLVAIEMSELRAV